MLTDQRKERQRIGQDRLERQASRMEKKEERN
jgi:hypothetical protein